MGRDLHFELKMYCIITGKKMKPLVNEIIHQYLEVNREAKDYFAEQEEDAK